MKAIFYLVLAVTVSSLACSCHNSTAVAGVEKTFKVWGNCEKCKARIEKAGELPGVSSIHWIEDTNELKLRIDSTVTSQDAVLNAIAEAGYDNERYTANAEAYAKLPECCQYERKTLKQ